jgi:hypothetical protein
LTGGHLPNGLLRKLHRINLPQHFLRPLPHWFSNSQIRPEGTAREEPRENGVATGRLKRRPPWKLCRNHSESLLQLGQIPPFATEDADLRVRVDDGVALTGHRLDKGGFAAAVGAEDGDVLAGVDGEVDVVEDDVVATGHVDVGKMQERGHSFLGYRTGLAAVAGFAEKKVDFHGTFLSVLTFYA